MMVAYPMLEVLGVFLIWNLSGNISILKSKPAACYIIYYWCIGQKCILYSIPNKLSFAQTVECLRAHIPEAGHGYSHLHGQLRACSSAATATAALLTPLVEYFSRLSFAKKKKNTYFSQNTNSPHTKF